MQQLCSRNSNEKKKTYTAAVLPVLVNYILTKIGFMFGLVRLTRDFFTRLAHASHKQMERTNGVVAQMMGWSKYQIIKWIAVVFALVLGSLIPQSQVCTSYLC